MRTTACNHGDNTDCPLCQAFTAAVTAAILSNPLPPDVLVSADQTTAHNPAAEARPGRSVKCGPTHHLACACRESAVAKLVEALEGLIDNEPCRFDHHGNCQTHKLNNPCEMAVARDALDEFHGRKP